MRDKIQAEHKEPTLYATNKSDDATVPFAEFFDLENPPEFGDLRDALRRAVDALEDIAGASWGVTSNGVEMTAKGLTIDKARRALDQS